MTRSLTLSRRPLLQSVRRVAQAVATSKSAVYASSGRSNSFREATQRRHECLASSSRIGPHRRSWLIGGARSRELFSMSLTCASPMEAVSLSEVEEDI
jgi:hypothetical protein